MERARIRGVAAVATAVVLTGAIAAMHASSAHSERPLAATPLPVVKVSPAVGRDIKDWQEYVGRMEAVERVEVRPRVAGTIAAVHFRDGDLVKQGSVLFSLDAAPYEARVQEAQAAAAVAEDRRRFTESELVRARRLQQDNAISRKEFDAAENAAREAQSSSRAAQAALYRARIDLGYTKIIAPISGRVSRAEITAGNVVEAGGAARALTSIVSLDPIYASFNVDEQTYLQLVGIGAQGGRGETVGLALSNESGFPRHGEIASVDNQLDTVSGTIRVRARFANPSGQMVPGLQAKVRIQASKTYAGVLVDEAAIGTDQDKKFAFVVGPDGKISYRTLALAGRQDGMRVVRDGIRVGEAVVVEGAQRVHSGDMVKAEPLSSPGSVAAVHQGGQS